MTRKKRLVKTGRFFDTYQDLLLVDYFQTQCH